MFAVDTGFPDGASPFAFPAVAVRPHPRTQHAGRRTDGSGCCATGLSRDANMLVPKQSCMRCAKASATCKLCDAEGLHRPSMLSRWALTWLFRTVLLLTQKSSDKTFSSEMGLGNAVTRSSVVIPKTGSGYSARRGLAFILLFSLLFQGFVLNTHIHGKPLLHGLSSAVAWTGGAVTDDGAPAGDPESCPTCHQIAHAGQYVTPAASALVAPSVAISVIALVFASPFVAAVRAFNWQGRAPPRH